MKKNVIDEIEVNNIIILIIEKLTKNKKFKRKSYLNTIITDIVSDVALRNYSIDEFQINFIYILNTINKIHYYIINEIYQNKQNINYLDIFTDKNFKSDLLFSDIHDLYNVSLEMYNITDNNITDVNNSMIELFNLLLQNKSNKLIKDLI